MPHDTCHFHHERLLVECTCPTWVLYKWASSQIGPGPPPQKSLTRRLVSCQLVEWHERVRERAILGTPITRFHCLLSSTISSHLLRIEGSWELWEDVEIEGQTRGIAPSARGDSILSFDLFLLSLFLSFFLLSFPLDRQENGTVLLWVPKDYHFLIAFWEF